MHIGKHKLANNAILAPMAGVTDAPFRRVCRKMGAGLVVSEMLSSNPQVWATEKSMQRMVVSEDDGIRSVQIAGSDPKLMAQAAQHNVANGAQIIDLNMGCPAKKVNKKLAGSALLQFPKQVESIIKAVVAAVNVPVTLKIRTGWDTDHRNGVEIAKIAEQNGIQALAVHGRTRACLFKGEAEYETIRTIKQNVSIPVIANGDITTPQKAFAVLKHTGADGIMIGRGAQGKPWIFAQILYYLEHGRTLPAPSFAEQHSIMREHIADIHDFYGEITGVRIARKHVGWYTTEHDTDRQFRRVFNALETPQEQLNALDDCFQTLQKRYTNQQTSAA